MTATDGIGFWVAATTDVLDSDPAPVPCSRVSEGTVRGRVGWVISGTDMMAEAGGMPTGLPLPVELDGVVATLSAPPEPWVLGVATVGDTGPGNGARSAILCSATSISCCCCNIAANCWLTACWTPCAADFATEFTRGTMQVLNCAQVEPSGALSRSNLPPEVWCPPGAGYFEVNRPPLKSFAPLRLNVPEGSSAKDN